MKKSTWTSKENHHSIETFIEAINKDVELATKIKPKKQKATQIKERDALKELLE